MVSSYQYQHATMCAFQLTAYARPINLVFAIAFGTPRNVALRSIEALNGEGVMIHVFALFVIATAWR